jgi:hypothetical protein
MDETGVERLAYDLSVDEVRRQERALDELRARTGTVLTASSIVASFLGSSAVLRHGHVLLTALGFAAFAVSIAASAYVLLPKKGLIFTFRGSALLREEESVPLAELHRRISYWLDDYYDANQDTIERLYGAFRVATFAVLIEAMMWLFKLAL